MSRRQSNAAAMGEPAEVNHLMAKKIAQLTKVRGCRVPPQKS